MTDFVEAFPSISRDRAIALLELMGESLTTAVNGGDASPPAPRGKPELFVEDLGWIAEAARDTRERLRSFAEDWDAPGMELHDDM
jgi:hypothetical protein